MRETRPRVQLTFFAATAFASAFLLFLVQPMFARMVLPRMGGSPGVWTSCLLFFQVALLAGYAWADAVPRLFGVRGQVALHMMAVCLPWFVLPIALPPVDGAHYAGAGDVLATAARAVGLPFVVLAASAPLLQAWMAAGDRRGTDPYVLYAASNAGSFAALVSYPWLIEPRLPLQTQSLLWAGGYVLTAVGLGGCALLTVRSRASATRSQRAEEPDAPLTAGRRVRWVALSLVPSSLLLGVTTFLTLDVAPVPLLWVVPLAIYLASFILVFSAYGPRGVAVCRRLLPYVLLPEVVLLGASAGLPLPAQVALHLSAFGVLAVLCHGALANDRPGVRHLTAFYLWLAVGGALGGSFNALVAPRVFSDLTEYPVALVLACALLASTGEFRQLARMPRLWVRPLAAGCAMAVGLWLVEYLRWPRVALALPMSFTAVLCFSLIRQPARFAASVGLVLAAGAMTGAQLYGSVLSETRTFFGVYRVARDGRNAAFHTLYNGTTIHGRERVGETPPEPLTYYHRLSPIGDVFAIRSGSRLRSVGVVGLGAGSLAAYAAPGQAWTFYEIDPEVERLARDTRWFHYLERCGAACTVVAGDGRLSLAASSARHDVIVLDAFSSDAIPLHLLTTEAAEVYLSRLAERGVLAFHISNRHLDLLPVMTRLATRLDLAGLARADRVTADRDDGPTSSVWVVLARDPWDIEELETRGGWSWLPSDTGPPWTDDFSSLWGVVRWWR